MPLTLTVGKFGKLISVNWEL